MVVAKHVPNRRLLWLQLDGGLHSLSAVVQFDFDKNLKKVHGSGKCCNKLFFTVFKNFLINSICNIL